MRGTFLSVIQKYQRLSSYGRLAVTHENYLLNKIFATFTSFPTGFPPSLQIAHLKAHRKRSQSPSHRIIGPEATVTARERQLSEQKHMVKTAGKAVVIFIAGYYYKPPVRGQFTACPQHYINSFMVFQKCSISYCP